MTLKTDALSLAQASEHEQQRGVDVLLTAKEYAELHRIHVQTVYSAIRYGHHLDGRVVRPSARAIRIAVSRESIQRLTAA